MRRVRMLETNCALYSLTERPMVVSRIEFINVATISRCVHVAWNTCRQLVEHSLEHFITHE